MLTCLKIDLLLHFNQQEEMLLYRYKGIIQNHLANEELAKFDYSVIDEISMIDVINLMKF